MEDTMESLSGMLYKLIREWESPKKKKKRREMLDQVYSNIAKILVTPTFYVVEEHKFDGFLFSAMFYLMDFEFYANYDYLQAKLWLLDAAANENAEAKALLNKYRYSIDRLREETSTSEEQWVFIKSGMFDVAAACLLRHKYLVDVVVAGWKLHTKYGFSVSDALNAVWRGRGAGNWCSVIQHYLPREDLHIVSSFFNPVDQAGCLADET